MVAFFDELQRNGFVDGQNLIVDARGYGLRVEQLAEHASELVKVGLLAVAIVLAFMPETKPATLPQRAGVLWSELGALRPHVDRWLTRILRRV